MREIKFRVSVYSHLTGMFLKFEYWSASHMCFSCDAPNLQSNDNVYGDDEQFTGRKIEEKNIYECDIVYITIFDRFGGDKQYLCRVEWWGSAFWLVSVKNEEDRWDLDWALSQDDEPEIRGNIHENPELLI